MIPPRVSVPRYHKKEFSSVYSDGMNTIQNFRTTVTPRDNTVPTEHNMDNHQKQSDSVDNAESMPEAPAFKLNKFGQEALSDVGLPEAKKTVIRTVAEIEQDIFDINRSSVDHSNMSLIGDAAASLMTIPPAKSSPMINNLHNMHIMRTNMTPSAYSIPVFANLANVEHRVVLKSRSSAEPFFPNLTYGKLMPNRIPSQNPQDISTEPETQLSVNVDDNRSTLHITSHGPDPEVPFIRSIAIPPGFSLPMNQTLDNIEHRRAVAYNLASPHSTQVVDVTEVMSASSDSLNAVIPQSVSLPVLQSNDKSSCVVQPLSETETEPKSSFSTKDVEVPQAVQIPLSQRFQVTPEELFLVRNVGTHLQMPMYHSLKSMVNASRYESDMNTPLIAQSTNDVDAPQESSQTVRNVAEACTSPKPMYHTISNVDSPYSAQSQSDIEVPPENFNMSQTALYNSLSSMDSSGNTQRIPEAEVPTTNLYPIRNVDNIVRPCSDCLRYPQVQHTSNDHAESDNNYSTRNCSVSHDSSLPMYHNSPYTSQTTELIFGAEVVSDGVSPVRNFAVIQTVPAPIHRNLSDVDSPYSLQSVSDIDVTPGRFHTMNNFVFPEAASLSTYQYHSFSDMDSPYSAQSSDIETVQESADPVSSIAGPHRLLVPVYQVSPYMQDAGVTPEQLFALRSGAVPQPMSAPMFHDLGDINSSRSAQSIGEAEAASQLSYSMRYALPQPTPLPIYHSLNETTLRRSFSDGFDIPQVNSDSVLINEPPLPLREAAAAGQAISVPLNYSLGNIAPIRFPTDTGVPRVQTQSLGDVIVQPTIPLPLYSNLDYTPNQSYFPVCINSPGSIVIPSVPTMYHSLNNPGLDSSFESMMTSPNPARLVPIYHNLQNVPRRSLIPVRVSSIRNSVQSIQAMRDAAARSEHDYYHPVFRG